MAALNKDETESLSLACRAMSDAALRLKRGLPEQEASWVTEVTLQRDEVEFMMDSLKKAERLVNTVKQMKGYYPS